MTACLAGLPPEDPRRSRRGGRQIEGFLERGEVNEWYEAAFDCLFDDTKIGYVRIKGPWAEIDTRTDLERARTL